MCFFFIFALIKWMKNTGRFAMLAFPIGYLHAIQFTLHT